VTSLISFSFSSPHAWLERNNNLFPAKPIWWCWCHKGSGGLTNKFTNLIWPRNHFWTCLILNIIMPLCNPCSTVGKGIHSHWSALITDMWLTGSICLNWCCIEVSLCCRLFFFFTFSPASPLQVPLFGNEWLHLLTCLGPHYWHVSGSFCLFKLMPLTSLLFQTSSLFWPSAAPTTCSG
jgi:hypothetical protein